MKDATGELSMTAVAVVAIAGLAGVFGVLIWPQLKTQIISSTHCANAFAGECGATKSCGGEMISMCYCTDSSCESVEAVCCNPDQRTNDTTTP